MFLIVGTLIHILVGAGMRFAFGWRFGVVATIFAAKEFGELKYSVAGSITAVGKNFTMLWELFTNPAIVSQWLMPAMAAWLVGAWLDKKAPARGNHGLQGK